MKVAVSIPDPVFAEADALATKLKLSRSRLYARALGDFVAGHVSDSVTEAMNAALLAAGQGPDPFIRAAGRRVVQRVEWTD